MWNDNDRKWLYEQMKKNGVNTGSYDDFTKSLDNKEDRDWYYQKSRSLGLNVGSADDFASMMVQPVQKPAQAPTSAPAQPVVKQTTGQVKSNAGQVKPAVSTSAQPKPKQEEQPGKESGWQPTLQQKMGMQMQLDETMRQMKQSQQDFSTRMENMRKSNALGNASEMKFNPGSGKMERRYYTMLGDEVATPLEQSRLNLKYRDEWEATTPEGQAHHRKRMEEARRSQVEDLSSDIDAALTDAKGRSVKQYTDYATENPFMAAMLSTAGAASPGDMQRRSYEQVQRSEHIPTKEAEQLHNEIIELEAAQRSMRDAKRIIGEADHNAQKGTFGKWLESSFAGGAARGLRQKLFDVDTWDFGGSDLSDAGALMTALNAYDRGEELTRSQQMLLDAKAVELATDAYFGSEVGNGYKAGKVTAESIPFMLEMCINPAAGTGRSAQAMMIRYARKRFGQQAVKNNVKKYVAAKIGARVAGDVVGAATMSATTGVMRTAADATERMNGQVMFDTDAQGQSVFAGHTDGDDAATAIAKAFANTTIENYSEMVGEYFAPVLGAVGKTMRKGMGNIGLESVNRFIDDVAANNVAKLVRDFEKHSKWNGMIGEYAEEVAGGIMNALVVGDQTLDTDPETGVFNLDRNIETFLGVALMGGFMSAVKTAGYRTPKYRAGQQVKQADEAALQEFGGNQDAWGAIRNTLAFGNDEDVKSMLAEVSTSAEYSDEQKMSVFEYSEAVERYKGVLKGEKKNNPDIPGTFETTDDVSRFGKVYQQETGGVADAVNLLFSQRSGMVRNVLHDERVGDIGMIWGDGKAGLCHMIMRHVVEQSDYESVDELVSAIDATLKNGELEVHGDNYIFMHDGNRAVVVRDTDGNYVLTSYDTTRSREEKKRSEADATRLYHDIFDREDGNLVPPSLTSKYKDRENILSNQENAEDVEDVEKDVMQKAHQYGYSADAQERRDIAIELASGENAEAQEAWNGVVQRINEDAAYMVAQQREQTKKMQHKTDGSIRPAILKEKGGDGNDQQVYIVDGDVQMMPDGSMVDKEASDNSVVIFNPATGERKMIDPTSNTGISSLGAIISADQLEADIERSRQKYVQAQIDEAQGTVRLVPGQQIVLPTGEEAVVQALYDDGSAAVNMGDGTMQTVDIKELQRIRDEKAMADYRQRHGITEEPATEQPEASAPAQPQADGRVSGAPAEYTPDMELTVRDDDGADKPAIVMGRVRYENGSFVLDPNGNIIEYFMDGEVKHDHADALADKVVSHVAPQQPEAAPVQETSAETPATVETTPQPVEQQAEVAPQQVQEPVQPVEPQPTQPAEAPVQAAEAPTQPTLEPMPVRQDGEEDWQATTPERAHAYIFNEAGLSRSEGNDFIAANMKAAETALEKAKSAQMPKVGTSIKKFNEAKAKRQAKIDEAQRALDYWNGVREIQNAIERDEAERRAAEDAVRREEAIAQDRADYEARKQAEAERKAVGNENPMPAITEKWNTATKVDGHRDEMVLPDGTPLKGHYVLHESGASSPSHNPETWQKTDGFPMDAKGGSVNDRDYERDRDAQEHTKSIAREYDQRALQSVPVVSNDGVVLSGNGRTMAGELAARDNTDGAYVKYLKEYAPKFGFTTEQVEAMQHPRVSFVPDEAMPYTAETFAKFNQQEMKSQNKTEQAVKLGKTVSDGSFKTIVRTINGYDTLGDFYNDAQASLGAVYDLHDAGVVPQAQLAEMVDGIRGQEKLSAVGREFLENMLIGKAFESEPEVVRMLTAEPAMRQTVITALGEIVDNIALGGEWSLQGELAEAVKLCYDARQGGRKYGEIVSTFARQGVLFAEPDQLQTVADFNNATMLMLADVLNDKRVTLLKTTIQLYNNNARQSAAGQGDLFAGGINSREDILRDVITFINENYGKRKEIEAARAAAVERRKAESVQEDGDAEAVAGGSENTGRSERGTEETPTLTHDEAISLIARMEERAGVAPEMELTIENWDAQFGKDGRVVTPIGEVKMGENQFAKLMRQGREGKLGMVKPTLETPDVIIEDASEAKDGDVAERKSSYVFVKAFKKADGSRYYYFTSVTVSKNGKEVVISNQEKSKKRISNLLQNGVISWIDKNVQSVSEAQSEESVPLNDSQAATQADNNTASLGINSSGLSESKGGENSATLQEKTVKVAENQSRNAVQAALAAAEQETNTESTEAQKEAGNYKKGHVKIDGYDVTIENPKGSVRRGTDASGKQWKQEMQNTYGYIRGTEGVDGDHIDVFFSDDPSQGDVFVVDQVNKDGSFDEHKVMYGFPDIDSARKAYLSNYEEGWQGLGSITPVSKEEFKKWIDSSHRKTKPFAEYSSVKPLGDTQQGEQQTISQDSEQVSDQDNAPYTIAPAQYTTKKGKVLDMYLVKFAGTLTKEQHRAAKELAKAEKGWYDREQGGFMMRSEESAKALAEALNNEEAVQDAQPVSMTDIQALNNGDVSFTEPQQPKEQPKDGEYHPIWQYSIHVDTDGYTTISRDDVSSGYPIGDGRFRYSTDSPEEMLDMLRNPLNGMEEALEAVGVTLENKIKTRELDRKIKEEREQKRAELRTNGVNGYKIGDKVIYTPAGGTRKAITATIHDFEEYGDNKPVLDVGLAPVLYEVADWETVEMPKSVKEYHGGDRVFSVKHNANKDIYMAHHAGGKVEYTFTDGTKANADEVQDALPMEQETQQTPFKNEQEQTPQPKKVNVESLLGELGRKGKAKLSDHIEEPQQEKSTEQPKQEEKKAKSKWVNDEDADRFEELRNRLRQKLRGQMNMGVDPEIFAIGVEMSYLMLKKGARKFNEFAKNIIEALGEEVRPYIKAFYNGARDLPEMADYEKEMTPYDEVRSFDVMNFDKKGAKDIVALAEHIVREQSAEREANVATSKIKKERNEHRKEAEQQIATAKERKSKKKTVSSQKQTMPDLFSGLTEEDNIKPTSNEQEVHVQPRSSTTERERGHQREQNEPLGESKQNENERTDAAGVVRRSGNNTMSDAAGSSRVSELSDSKRNVRPAKPEPAPLAESERKNTHNNTAERGTDYAPKSTSARIEANIKAIETMQRLIESGEPATPEDMSVLRKFSGWGGLGAAFKEKVSSGDSSYNPRLRDDYQPANPINARLRELLSPEAYEAAQLSRNTAFYTPAPIIDAMWDVARAMGFRGGNVLEGSAGIGNIIGLMPTDMSERSDIQAVEVDETTGNILKLLYPDANVEVQGFEKTYIPNGSVDLAITNVPFGDILVKDETGDKDLSKKFRAIHDFCIAKNVRKLKEGGIGIFISTSGTLDSPSSAKLRTWLVNEGNADVVGAFRMHKNTFGGAGVTSDIIVVRKRVNGRKSANAIDVSGTLPIRTVKYDTGETKRGSNEVIIKDLALDVNKHFVEHPEDMAGEMAFAFEKGGTYRETSKALYPSPSINQEQRLSEWAQQFKDMDWDKAEERESQQVVYADLGEDVKEGSMLLDRDGNLCLAQRGKAVPINVNANKVKGHTKAECFNAYKAIKDALADVLEYQTTHSDDSGLQQRLAKLNKAYDSFVKTYGHLNKNTSISFLRSDMDYPSIAALESVSETGDKSGKRIVTYGKTDIFSRRVVETESEPKPTTIKDGIIASIYLNGRVDVPYIAEQLNMSDSDVRRQIIESGLGFENPTTTEMEVSYEYLSGNVREKLRQAQENNTDGRYDANIKALERVIPMNIPAHLIEFTLGSSWVEPKLYEDFVKERTGLDVKLTNTGGTWIMSEPYYTNTEQNKAMGVISEKCDKTILGHELIKAAITCKSISVTKTISTGYGSSKTTETIVDKEATMACANKIDEIRQDFKDWARGKMQGDPEMSERMELVYNELFNNSVPKEIPDDFVPEHFGGAATVVNGKPFKLRPHQAKAVIRATTQPLMLAHEVGTGKTYTLISTAMEMRRLGTARKPMIVVQNATVGQFVASAKALYPNAKILTLEDADRNAEGRRNFYAKIRYNDWDMIVVPQSVFERIPDSEERQIRFVEDKVEEKMMVLEKMREAANDDRDPVLRQAQRELDQLNDELNDLKLALQERKAGGKTEKDEKREAKTRQNAMVKAQEMLDRETDDVANFDDMGIDALLIDEAHEYKHLGFATAMQRGVKGVDPSYSKKSQGVYLKTQAVLENKNGKNVVFATGTPISNTAAEIWTFMRYLMPADTMREYGIYYFDDFVRNFGNIQQMLEFSTNGKYKENNRFAGYVNLPELVRIWAGVADTVLTREAGGVSDKIPKMDGGKAQDIYLPQTKALRGVMKFVKDQLDDYEKMSGKEKKENSHIPLVMYGIAKAAAVDARLVLEDAADESNSKTNEAVRQTLRSLEDTKGYNGTVAIFADNYQNKATGFNLYEDIRKKLIDAGVPEAQVVVMKSGMSIKKKLEIFDKVNRGEVRVIMGSTFTLGTGVNIQERLHTLIHVDAPNRPMDYTQRNGRILRQGNLHNEWGIPVRVLRFGVEDSLDVTAYQRLKTKGAIADSIMEGKKMMSNSMENRVLEEEQDLFGDITAQLSGSQYALLKNQVEKEVRKLEARKKQWEADQTYVHNQKPRLKALIKDSEERAKRNKEALAKVEAAKNDGITIGKVKFPSLDAMGDYIKDYNSKQREQQEQVRTASGYQAEAKSDLTVSVGGFDFHIHRVITKEQKQEKGQLSLSFISKTQMTYSCPQLGLEDVPVDGQRLKSALEDILENVLSGDDFREKAEDADRAAERYKGELQQVEARDGKPFEYADELKQAKEKLAEYEELMKAEMAEKEAKYAEMDASVEAAKGVQLSEEDTEDVTEDTAKYRTSDELTEEYGDRWLTEQTNDDGRHTTQVKNTINSYKKFGEWVQKDSRGRDVSVLDASSGLGLGTQWMRENGMMVDDVEPYPSANREKPTFGSYAEIDKKYDYIISNAVLNVIPDDWRSGLLHDMADKLKPGGKLVINVRGAETIRTQGKEGVTRITLDDASEILVLRPDGSIKAYQKGFTKDELQDWCEAELGDGYTVLKANKENAGGTYDTAVVVVKNNESTAKGSASELGQPTENGAAVANFGANLWNNSERAKRLSDLSMEISRTGALGSHQLLHGLNVALDLSVTPKEGGRMSTDQSRYYDLGSGVSLRVSDHQGNADTFARVGHPENNYGIVIKLSRSRFKDKEGVDYLEYVYYGDRVNGAARQKEIVDGLRAFVESGDLSKLPRADKVNGSGRFKDAALPQQMERSTSAKRLVVEELAEKLHTNINIIEDVNEITHPNADIQEQRRRAKGWYDKVTRQVYVVLPNNRDVDDAKATTAHETIAHKGLREMIGRERYDEFLDEVYGHLRDDLKKGVDAAAGRAFIDDTTKNGKRAKSYEQHRRTAVDELFGRLAEKPFEEFSEGERTLWQKLKAAVRRLLDKFLGTLKLPKWFELGDNELRYILWRSKERLERGKEHPIDLARDIVKREELGLTDEARYNMGDAPETFKARQKRAVENKGTVMPGLNDAQVKVVDVPKHSYTGSIKEATQQAIDAAKAKYVPNGNPRVLHYDNFGVTFDYSISGSAVEESLNPKQQAKSVNKGVHIAMAEHLDEIIGQSIEVEEHPDYLKNEKGERNTSIINDKALMHRFYGAVVVDGVHYRVMTLMREEKNPIVGNGIHAYEVQKIEVLDETPNTPNGVGSHPQSEIGSSYPLAKLLQNVGKSYEKDKNLLNESKLADESTDLYRDPDDTDDVWTDGSLGLQERITAAATRLANNHRDDKTLRNDAMRAIGGNLADLRKAMSLQRTFDMTTVKRVADLARVLITNGYINNATSYEIKRLLSAVKNSVGRNDIESDVQKVMDIMVNNQLKHAEETLEKLESIKGSKVDARGVEVQGELDPAGAHIMKVFKKTRGWEKTDIEEAIADAQQRMGSSDQAVADEAALEYTGLQLAQEYAETIKDSKTDERKLRDEIKQAHDDASERDRATDSYRQYIAILQEAIRQNKIERVQAYYELVGRLSGSLRESIANAQAFKEAEKQRIREIQHNANSDMEGRPSDEHYKPTFMDKFVNNSFVSFLFAPLATFDQMLRMFGGKSANGEGYLYNRFMRGWVDARQKEIRGVRDKYAILDAKAAEMFGGKVKTWGDLIRRVGKLPKGFVSFWNGGEMQEREMTQGNLMYIYMVNKMLDGRMKLRKMGITEENVAEIEEVLDPRLKELADWLQDEFLVQTRNEYNETHKRMFGASMAAIEHYFPLKILANARADKPEDLDSPDKGDGISTATGSIIKRRRNALALDITGADALSVILDHVAQMEHWNAFAEFNRDINTLRTYKRFRNQVQNMTTIYGSGKDLWRKFNDVCQMAAGTYRPPRARLDEAATNFAKGVTAAKVSFRMFTAFKQFLSMPAYLPEARADYLLRNIANPVGAWKWSMEHLPIFNERWRSRMSGDPRLLKSDMDWKMWRTRIMQLASRAGMSPNAFVDALTVSIGAHAMYQTRKSQYLRDGYSKADAEKKAVQDAEVLYNQTQQSSEGAFTSTMQVDRSWLSVLFTVFRNASMSYQRQLHDSLRNFKHNLTPGGRARSIEFMTKQLLRDKGYTQNDQGEWDMEDWRREETIAKRKFNRQLRKDMLRVATFGYIMQFAWNLGAYLPYLLFGDDDDEKQKMWDDVFAHTMFGSVEGLTGGDLMSQAGQMVLTGEGNPAYLSKDMPLTSDIMEAFKKLGNGQHAEALNDMINLVVQSGLGVNPQSITDGVLAIMDACGDDPALAHEATICISRILQVPQSQIDKMYFDEVGLSGDEVSKYTPAQLAERYAEYKVKRGRFFSPGSWDDEERIGKFADKANKTIKERTEQMGDDEVNESYARHAEAFKEMEVRVKDLNKSFKETGSDAERKKIQEDIQYYMTGGADSFYQMFKQMDSEYSKIVKSYLRAKTPDEAALCRQAVLDYKSAMVKVLEAPDDATRAEAMDSLGTMMQDFYGKYEGMQQINR